MVTYYFNNNNDRILFTNNWCFLWFHNIVNLAIEAVFRVSTAASKHEGQLGDAIKGLHNCHILI